MTSRRHLLKLALSAPVLARAAAAPAPSVAPEMAPESFIARIRPLFKRMDPTRPGDWLAEHAEPGQTYQQYRKAQPDRVIDRFRNLRIVPIGPLTEGQRAVLEITVDFMKPFFGLPLVLDPQVPLSTIPANAQRELYQRAPKQLLTSYLLNQVLRERRRDEDAAVLGITGMDLWPGAGWNFVFGQASLTERVGVWSMARNGNADHAQLRKLCAVRTVMTATHETGHMFGIRHCIAYKCGMNGSNNASERDRQPLEFCPECQPKLWWSLALDPLRRSRALESAARRHGFDRIAADLGGQSRALAGS